MRRRRHGLLLGGIPRRKSPLDQRAAHVAAAQNRKRFRCHGGDCKRMALTVLAPKSAVPMRTIVAPSADRGLKVRAHAHGQRIERCAPRALRARGAPQARRSARALRSASASGGGMLMSPRRRRRGREATCAASAGSVVGGDAALGGFTRRGSPAGTHSAPAHGKAVALRGARRSQPIDCRAPRQKFSAMSRVLLA